jgi:hypothetical protein
MALNEINPLRDERWPDFLKLHPRASVFHSRAWLEALQRAYGYTPIVYTTSQPGDRLRNGLVFCAVESWITGRRLVSVPFSDHCEPLVEDPADLNAILPLLAERSRDQRWRYVELRPRWPLHGAVSPFSPGNRYCFHQLDLTPEADALFRNFHKSSTQRKIRRAERDGLRVESGNSVALLDDFLGLNMRTRRRHHLPPQPRSWFLNLLNCFAEALKIYVAYNKDQAPVAAILTLRFNGALIFKYGCSDSKFNNLGGTQFLFWRAIQEGKCLGLRTFDLGRSDLQNTGLITFKDRLGSERTTLTYMRYPEGRDHLAENTWRIRVVKRVFAFTPDPLLSAIGNVVYKHIG